MKTKFFTILFAIVASIGTLCAQNIIDGIAYWFYQDNGGYAVVTSGVSYSGDIVIPETVTSNNGVTYRVVAIEQFAFRNCGITSVTIPNSVTSIGLEAFKECHSLTSVVLGNSVAAIADYAFFWCGLTSIEIPSSVTSIGKYAFSSNPLTSVTIPSSVTSIGLGAFICSSLTSVMLNSNSIVERNYSYDSSLKNKFGLQVEEYILGDRITGIGNFAFSGCSDLTSVTIGKNVTKIYDSAFYRCSKLNSVTWNAKNCSDFTSQDSPFYHHEGFQDYDISKQITSFTFGEEVEYIPAYLCRNMSITAVTIPNSVTSIGKNAFWQCTGLNSVTIPNNVTSIGEYAFAYCKGLTSVSIGNSVTSIGDWAFNSCSRLTSVTIGNSVTSIGEYAFAYCNKLASVNMPNSVTSVGDDAFNSCFGLTAPLYNAHVFAYMPETYSGSYTIQDGIKSIAGGAVSSCRGLASIEIPNSVTSIGKNAFRNCTGLTSVTCHAVIPPIMAMGDYSEGGVFNGVQCANIPLYVPKGSIAAYKAADQWKDFKNISGIPGTEDIEDIVIDSDSSTRKFLRDGQIFILRGDKTYTLQGQEVK